MELNQSIPWNTLTGSGAVTRRESPDGFIAQIKQLIIREEKLMPHGF